MGLPLRRAAAAAASCSTSSPVPALSWVSRGNRLRRGFPPPHAQRMYHLGDSYTEMEESLHVERPNPADQHSAAAAPSGQYHQPHHHHHDHLGHQSGHPQQALASSDPSTTVVTAYSDGAQVLQHLRHGVLGPRSIQLAVVENSGGALLEAVLVMLLLAEDLAADGGVDNLVLFQPCIGDVASTSGRTYGALGLLITRAKCPTWQCRPPSTSYQVASNSVSETAAAQLAAAVLDEGSVRMHCAPGPAALVSAFALLKMARKAVKATGSSDILVCPRTEGGYDAEGRELASVAFDIFKQRLPQRAHTAHTAAAGAHEASNVVASQRRH